MLRVFNGLIELNLLADIVSKNKLRNEHAKKLIKFLQAQKCENYLRFKIMRKVTA